MHVTMSPALKIAARKAVRNFNRERIDPLAVRAMLAERIKLKARAGRVAVVVNGLDVDGDGTNETINVVRETIALLVYVEREIENAYACHDAPMGHHITYPSNRISH